MNSLTTPMLLAPLLLAVPAAAQVPAPGAGDQGPRLVGSSDALELLHRYEQAQGGIESLQGLRVLRFSLVSSRFDAQGNETVDPEPLHVDLELDGEKRRVRIEEDLPAEGESGQKNHLVKLSDAADDSRVWADGVLLSDAAIREAARLYAQQFLMYFDLLTRPRREDVAQRFDGRKTRDGVEFDTLHVEFHVDRQVFEAFRVFYGVESGLIGRIDAFDVKTYRRLRSVVLSGYQLLEGDDLEGVKLPTRFEFRNQSNKPVLAWTLLDLVRNPEVPVGHFESL